ncbi:putative phage protein (TIGR01671 family) [Sporomusaceae bacterium BoRhaA]|uniref:YopX family protein n=1 Tax=Pelorhabdus rhamnosifermentans TaxID=2772457 RepID=UPI001C06137B|nr:YopX family protein [Pelorhabdus rhamnosifermentans]MBU2704128.1 putative phage protein (TIGR01671 family) [Pelorhabdus rhamnosifermentans]
MRKHKFRAWDEENKVMIPWDQLKFDKDPSEEIVVYRQVSAGEWEGIEPELMEYTGLKDKNGAEGCQDDILDTHVGKAVIKLGKYGGTGDIEHYNVGFYVDFLDRFTNSAYRHELGYWLPQSVIIGNIHDNPELLAGKQS